MMLVDVTAPVHDWAIRLGDGSYGFSQWGNSDCSIYFGTRLVTLNSPAPVMVATLLFLTIPFLFFARHLIWIAKKKEPTAPRAIKLVLWLWLAVFSSLNAFADDAKDVQGSWKPVKAELAGQPMADDVIKSIRLKMDNGKYEVFVGDKPDKGTYTIDSTTKPKSMTIIGTEGPNHDKTFPAIYELEGDTLRICYDLSGAKRPTEFKTVAGTQLYLVNYNRKKE